jgi:transcription initiation factor TFIIIB Brf1 subunit/transcription initiation factor TFIIB
VASVAERWRRLCLQDDIMASNTRDERHSTGSRQNRHGATEYQRAQPWRQPLDRLVRRLSLPSWVGADADVLLQRAIDESVVERHQTWNELAAGAVVVALAGAGIGRTTEAIAAQSEASHGRVCAVARQLRCGLALVDEVVPTYPWAVEAVVATLGDRGLDTRTCLDLSRRATFLLELADEAGVGSKVSRVTVAAAAICAASQLRESSVVTAAEVAAAATETLQTSKGAVVTYASEIVQMYGEQYGQRAMMRAMLERRV